uniref:Ral transcription factor IIIC subunit 6 n=1 Tax=Macaca fascicularis TaxID=9541 RepID=A0A2K5U7F8_MACFA
MKKLSMTRTLLTEKKEGEENIGGVEWLQIKDNDFSYRPNMICSFLHENEDEEVAASAPDKFGIGRGRDSNERQFKPEVNRRNQCTWI